MNKQFIIIRFGLKGVLFFILLEALTVPMVAMSNFIAVQNRFYMLIMGFWVAFVVVLFLVRVLKALLIRNSLKVFGVKFENVSGLWYIGVLAGILEMIMFFVQDLLFSRGWNDFSCGFVSAFFSVGATLVIYELVAWTTGFSIKFYQTATVYRLRFAPPDILLVAGLLACYEFIVCPITGWWIPYTGIQRLALAILSGIIGGASGGLLLFVLNRFKCCQARLIIQGPAAA